MKIFVFGSNGMLGRYVSTYLKMKEYEIVDITRKEVNVTNHIELFTVLHNIEIKRNDVVINCIGLVKQRKDIDDLEFIMVNSVFPHILANFCEMVGAHMIHPSTDCVYSGLRGSYFEDDVHDVTDMYGRTKSLGEPKNVSVIRTSIIGEEVMNKTSFIEWVKSNKNKTVNGYTNHYWNGITCLEFAEIVQHMINTKSYWKGARNIFTPISITKYDLANLVSEIFDLGVIVNPIETPIMCDRTLVSKYINYFDPPVDYRTQLIKLCEYHKILIEE